jgi:hypothetical protein
MSARFIIGHPFEIGFFMQILRTYLNICMNVLSGNENRQHDEAAPQHAV